MVVGACAEVACCPDFSEPGRRQSKHTMKQMSPHSVFRAGLLRRMGMAGVCEVVPFPLMLGLGRMAGGVVTSLPGVLQADEGSFRVKCPFRDCGLLCGVLPQEFCMSRTPMTSS